jgi:endonuclease YncB( thermonuclease family)
MARQDAHRWLAALGACAALLACGQRPVEQAAVEPATADAGVASEIYGIATATTGDAIRVGDRRIRFDGVDAPNQAARCGEINVYRRSADALSEAIARERVRCVITDAPDREGRTIATCRAGERDLSQYMVSQGWARDWPRFSDGAYADEEAAARAARRGVWGLECPADVWGEFDSER